jgi:hypothetical protein
MQSITKADGKLAIAIQVARDPATGKRQFHRKTVNGRKADANAYLAWYTGLMAAGEAPAETVSQRELQELAWLERKAAKFREKLIARVEAGGKVEPGPLAIVEKVEIP